MATTTHPAAGRPGFALPDVDYYAHPAFRSAADRLDGERSARVRSAHERLQALVREQYPAERLSRDAGRAAAGGPLDRQPGRSLAEDGISVFALPAAFAADIVPRLNALLDRLNANGASQIQYYLEPDRTPSEHERPLTGIAQRLAGALDLRATAAAVLGVPSPIVKLTLRSVTPADAAHFLDRYAGDGQSDPETVGMHFDYPANSVKLMVYLTEVADRPSGAFGYIPGSHRRDEAYDDTVARLATDALAKQPGFRLREDLMALPAPWRRRANFGDDLAPGSPAAAALVAQERVVTGPAGTCILFDTLGVHRGGLVRHGQRRVLQLGVFDGSLPDAD
jgi:hypothetical protein